MATVTTKVVEANGLAARRLHLKLTITAVLAASITCSFSPFVGSHLLSVLNIPSYIAEAALIGVLLVLFGTMAAYTRAHHARDFIDYPISLALLFAIPITLIFYYTLAWCVNRPVDALAQPQLHAVIEFVDRVFFRQAWISILIVMIFWSGAMCLLLQWFEVNREARFTKNNKKLIDLIGKDVAYDVEQAAAFCYAFDGRKGVLREFLDTSFAYRLQQSFNRVKMTKSSVGVDSLLNSMSSTDVETAEASQRYLHFILFLLPAMGFLGTIIGLSVGLGNFKDAVSANADISVILKHVGPFLEDLGMAFSTTLLGLVGSIFISLGAAAVGKRVDQLLSRIDSDCVEVVVSRLKFADPTFGETTAKLQTVCDVLSGKTARERADELATTIKTLKEAVDPLKGALDEVKTACNSITTALNTSFATAIQTFVDNSRKSAGEAWIKKTSETAKSILDATSEAAKSLTSACTTYSAQIDKVSKTLEQSQTVSTKEELTAVTNSVNAIATKLQTLQDDITQRIAQTLAKAMAPTGGRVTSQRAPAAPTPMPAPASAVRKTEREPWWRRLWKFGTK